jgi:hypothetical protein
VADNNTHVVSFNTLLHVHMHYEHVYGYCGTYKNVDHLDCTLGDYYETSNLEILLIGVILVFRVDVIIFASVAYSPY